MTDMGSPSSQSQANFKKSLKRKSTSIKLEDRANKKNLICMLENDWEFCSSILPAFCPQQDRFNSSKGYESKREKKVAEIQFKPKEVSNKMEHTNGAMTLTSQIFEIERKILENSTFEECWHTSLLMAYKLITESSYLSTEILQSFIYGIMTTANLSVARNLKNVIKLHSVYHPHNEQVKELFYKVGCPSENFQRSIKRSGLEKIELEECTFSNIIDSLIEFYGKKTDVTSIKKEENIIRKVDELVPMPKEETAQRLFECIEIYADLIENAFCAGSYSILQNRHLSELKMLNANKWETKDFQTSILHVCEKIYNAFTICPKPYRKLFGRFISSMVVVADEEQQHERGKPFPSTFFNNFAFSVAKVIRGKKNYVYFVEHISSRWLQLLVCYYLIEENSSPLNQQFILSNQLKTILLFMQRNLLESKNILKHTKIKRKGTKIKELEQCGRANFSTCKQSKTTVHNLCRLNKAEELEKLLLDPFVDVNITDRYGYTPLHVAVRKQSIDCIEVLIKSRLFPPTGAEKLNLAIPSNKGITPLIECVNSGNKNMMKLLLSHGAVPHNLEELIAGNNIAKRSKTSDMKHLLESEWNIIKSTYKWLNIPDDTMKLITLFLYDYMKLYYFEEVMNNGHMSENSKLSKKSEMSVENDNIFQQLHELILRLKQETNNPKMLQKMSSIIESAIELNKIIYGTKYVNPFMYRTS